MSYNKIFWGRRISGLLNSVSQWCLQKHSFLPSLCSASFGELPLRSPGVCHSFRCPIQTRMPMRGCLCFISAEAFPRKPQVNSSLVPLKDWVIHLSLKLSTGECIGISMTGSGETGFNPESCETRVDTQTKCKLSRKEGGYTGLNYLLQSIKTNTSHTRFPLCFETSLK